MEFPTSKAASKKIQRSRFFLILARLRASATLPCHMQRENTSSSPTMTLSSTAIILRKLRRCLTIFPRSWPFLESCSRTETLVAQAARGLIRTWQDQEHSRGRLFVDKRFPQLHGCNLIMRRTLLTRETFDEALPAYSLGEDYDLWVRISRYGFTGKYDRCIAVHLKASGGRLSPRKMAYSHLANHWHFLRKGVSSLPVPWSYARFVCLCIKLPLRSLIELLRGYRAQSTEELHGYMKAIGDILEADHVPREFRIFRIRPMCLIEHRSQ